TFVADDWRSHSPDFTGERFRRNLQVVDRLKDFARESAISLPQLAVAWTLSNPAVQVAIVGARRPEHLDDTTAAAEVNLSGADRPRRSPIPAGLRRAGPAGRARGRAAWRRRAGHRVYVPPDGGLLHLRGRRVGRGARCCRHPAPPPADRRG